MIPTQDPTETVENGPLGGVVSSHPAFGQISVVRTSGQRTLYGSDFQHNSYVTIKITESELRRDISRDWHFQRGEIVEVCLSEAQWATFVSSFSVGSGVPCTIRARDGKYVPEFPLRDSGQLYRAEADQKLMDSVNAIKRSITDVEANAIGLSKAKVASITDSLKKTLQELEKNLPFVAAQFSEHMEERVEKAKVEVEAYMTNAVVRAGLEALQEQKPIGMIEIDNG